MLKLFLFPALFVLIACSGSGGEAEPEKTLCGEIEYDPETHLCDRRDYQLYKHVTIGDQTWMAENLNYESQYPQYDNMCYSGNDANCSDYGRLYARGDFTPAAICPRGWHLPSDAEWSILTNQFTVSGNYAKFNPLPGGYGWLPQYSTQFSFSDMGNSGRWWTATSYDEPTPTDINKGWIRRMSDGRFYREYENIRFLLSVRCVKD
jgi:uncharacterized protein (TIGR02145 family)